MLVAPTPPPSQSEFVPIMRSSWWRLLGQIWIFPRRALATIAGGPGWIWAAPMASAFLFLYLRFILITVLQDSSESVPLFSGGLVAILGGWLVRALILNLIGRSLGGRADFQVTYRLTAWAGFPLILREAVQVVFMAVSRTPAAMQGLGSLLARPGEAPQPSLFVFLLDRIDVYALWYLFLLFLAVKVGTGLGSRRAALVVGGYAILALIPGFLVWALGVMFRVLTG